VFFPLFPERGTMMEVVCSLKCNRPDQQNGWRTALYVRKHSKQTSCTLRQNKACNIRSLGAQT